MQVIKEVNALSEFRSNELIKLIKKVNKNITGINAEYVHFINGENLSKADLEKAHSLVTYGEPYDGKREGLLILVTPRTGTISPWSSKATDIMRNAGLKNVLRVERGTAYYLTGVTKMDPKIEDILRDRMTETVFENIAAAEILFDKELPRQLVIIDILKNGRNALDEANKEMGLALSENELNYLFNSFKSLKRNPTDVEVMMFGQINSEHCRHKIFNADWNIDGIDQPKSLFKMITNTYEKGGENVLSAYKDNAAVVKGPVSYRFFANKDREYGYIKEPIHSVIKVETHNHPTAISPIPGAATGIGGEIRDEAATGRGAKSKMGMSGFSVSNLKIKDHIRPWEIDHGKPGRIASSLDIMKHAPIGGSGFANEFGRPNLVGYFRSYEQEYENEVWGYHKPIMIAGGLGNIRDMHVQKNQLSNGSLIIVLGGPAMLIGLGGGAASSMQTGSSSEKLDYASVQRGNGEIERRAQEVIDRCWELGDKNPLISIHDVGAGGLSNALPELIHDSNKGAVFELRDIPSAEPGLSPLEIWSNEAQERYVMAIDPEHLDLFDKLCERERCPYSVVGKVTDEEKLVLVDSLLETTPVDMPLDILFGKVPRLTKTVNSIEIGHKDLELKDIKINEAIERVLTLPSVASKKFLITIGDRTVGGLVTRDQMVGPWQVPVSDVAVSATSFEDNYGEAMAIGERTPLAIINPAAAARMAIAESITNILASDVKELSDIKLSANWMAASGYANEDQALFESVKAVGEEFCPELGLTIPVGKDSLSMRTQWEEDGTTKSVVSPVSLVITAFSNITDVNKTLTAQLCKDDETTVVLINLGGNEPRLGGSALAQVYNQVGSSTPDADADTIKDFLVNINNLKQQDKLLAYHDRSDGGLMTTLLEMSFAGRVGLDIDISKLGDSTIEFLFNEELGVVIQVADKDLMSVQSLFGNKAIPVAKLNNSQSIKIHSKGELIYQNSRSKLEKLWAETSYLIQAERDNPASSSSEYGLIEDDQDPGITPKIGFDLKRKKFTNHPKVAIFREEGVNGQTEMAAAFYNAGFTAIDVHLNDILSGRQSLDDYVGLAACGGFSYGDVLGAGEGWAKTILFNEDLRDKFTEFFERQDTFTLGVCNGCQALSALKELIPGAQNWPAFKKNVSEQFEARLVTVQINESPSILLNGMAGSKLIVPTAHGEGRAEFSSENAKLSAETANLIAAQYVDNYGKVTEQYPLNPNGSADGITALTTHDGRATIIMPHPERAFLSRQLSWHPKEWGTESPWMEIFNNARKWVG